MKDELACQHRNRCQTTVPRTQSSLQSWSPRTTTPQLQAITDSLTFTFTWLLIMRTWLQLQSHSPTLYNIRAFKPHSLCSVFLYQYIPSFWLLIVLIYGSDPVSSFFILLLIAIIYVVCTSLDSCQDLDTVFGLLIGFICKATVPAPASICATRKWYYLKDRSKCHRQSLHKNCGRF